jgi:crotonobetainyl-CoA:carnitine CoA-transferase CaiB-like acyl-CoA transferase
VGPLEGIKVIDMSEFVAAPSCARALGEMGAEVIKIEPLAKDILRVTGSNIGAPCSDDENPVFNVTGLNKKFMSVSLKTENGRKIAKQLIAKADVFVTSYRDGALKHYGLTYEDVSALNPRIVMGHISGYGEVGPDKDLPGYDFTSYVARGGILHNMTPAGASEPIISFNAFGDMQVGMTLAAGVLSALVGREKTGKGDYVDVSLYGTAVYMGQMGNFESQYGVEYPKTRNKPSMALINTFKASDDRWIYVCIGQHDRLYNKFMEVIGRPDLVDDERFSTYHKILKSNGYEELTKIIEEAIAKKPSDYWDRVFKEADLTAQRAASFEDINTDPQAFENDFVRKVTFKSGNTGLVYPIPTKFKSAGKGEIELPKALGYDNEEILTKLGYTKEDMENLRSEKTII